LPDYRNVGPPDEEEEEETSNSETGPAVVVTREEDLPIFDNSMDLSRQAARGPNFAGAKLSPQE
jgi:hypothetical protein